MRVLRPLIVSALAAAAAVGTLASPAAAQSAPQLQRTTRALRTTPTLPHVAPKPRVTVIGDSITHGACGKTDQHIPDYLGVSTAACFGWSGATSDEMQHFVQDQGFRSQWPNMLLPEPTVDLQRAINSSDYLVIGLGTNDALRDRWRYDTSAWPARDVAAPPSGHVPVDNGYFDTKIDYFMQLAQGKRVYWYDLGIQTIDPASFYYFSHRNEHLYAAMKRWPNLTVLPWGGVVGSHPEYLMDEVHPNEAGRIARWDLLQKAISG